MVLSAILYPEIICEILLYAPCPFSISNHSHPPFPSPREAGSVCLSCSGANGGVGQCLTCTGTSTFCLSCAITTQYTQNGVCMASTSCTYSYKDTEVQMCLNTCINGKYPVGGVS